MLRRRLSSFDEVWFVPRVAKDRSSMNKNMFLIHLIMSFGFLRIEGDIGTGEACQGMNEEDNQTLNQF